MASNCGRPSGACMVARDSLRAGLAHPARDKNIPKRPRVRFMMYQLDGSSSSSGWKEAALGHWLLALTSPNPALRYRETRRSGATTKPQDLQRGGREETEDWREEKQLQHRGAGEEEPEGAGSGNENLRKKRRKFEISNTEKIKGRVKSKMESLENQAKLLR